MRIFCLIAFVFLATSFTTNNANFEKVSNSESLEVEKPNMVYLVTAYKKSMTYPYEGYDRVKLKVNVTTSYGTKSITVISYEDPYNYQSGWSDCSYGCSAQNVQYYDPLHEQFSYSWNGHYFND